MARSPRLLVAAVVLAGGCVSVPDAPDPLPAAPTPAQVRTAPEAYRNATVRWGGRIARVENLRNETILEIVGYRLDHRSRPSPDAPAGGRFLARAEGFLDPMIYAEGREITLEGTVQDTTHGSIGSHPYVFPVLRAASHRLWNPRVNRDVILYPEPFWYWNSRPYPFMYSPYGFY